MRGWRCRIGLIYPADGLIDDEFWRFVPDGVAVYITRIYVPPGKITLEFMVEMGGSEEIERSAKMLTIVRPHVIAFACTSASFVRGSGYDKEIIKKIEEISGIRATTTSTAVVDGLRELSIRRVAVATPYKEEVNIRLERFLTDNGFEVVSLKGLQLDREWDISNVPPGEVYRLTREVDRPEADGIFIACTGFPTAEVLETLELDLGKPVISANQATMWQSLKIAGIRSSVKGYGKLLEIPR